MRNTFPFLVALALWIMTSPAFSGQVGGPRKTRDTVMPSSTDVFGFVFEKNEPATIRVKGDGSQGERISSLIKSMG